MITTLHHPTGQASVFWHGQAFKARDVPVKPPGRACETLRMSARGATFLTATGQNAKGIAWTHFPSYAGHSETVDLWHSVAIRKTYRMKDTAGNA